jgi:hypothetical protein
LSPTAQSNYYGYITLPTIDLLNGLLMRDSTPLFLFRFADQARAGRRTISSWPLPSQAWATIVRAVQRKWAFKNVPGRSQRRRKAEARLLAASPLFDREWYLRTYPDVAEAGADALGHYVTSGWREGRDPGPEFATSAYLLANPDVAQSGSNPLLHYIEFGYIEGRGSSGHRPPLQSGDRVAFDFADVDRPVSFAIREAAPPPWVRAYRLDSRNPDSIAIGDVMIGYSHSSAGRDDLANAALLFGLLSGIDSVSSDAGSRELPRSAHHLVDAWYVNRIQLRTRWSGESSQFVLRALQYDPECAGTISLVADSLVSSPIDTVDIHLRNAFYPVLFVFCDPDGDLAGCRLLAFPSLCRGGAHYPELIAATEGESTATTDILDESDRLARRLLRLKTAGAAAAVARIDVDLTDCAGTGALFQPDFRKWLQQVVGIGISGESPTATGPSAGFLDRIVELETPHRRAPDGATLALAHDMIPTIRGLTEPRADSSAVDGEILVPLLVASSDPAEPGSLIELPRDMAPLLRAASGRGLAAWPRLLVTSARIDVDTFPPAAIRVLADEALDSAELMVPAAAGNSSPPSHQRPAITWLIDAADWRGHDLGLSIQCIALQAGGAADRMALVGAVDPATRAMTETLFTGRVSSFADVKMAVESLATPLAGFIGAGVLLHDVRWADVTSAALNNEAVASASSAIVRIEGRAGRWQAAQVRIGSAAGHAKIGDHQRENSVLRGLWRSTFPVGGPPQDLWLARSSALADWTGGAAESPSAGLIHLCSFLVTASHVGGRGAAHPPIFVPDAAPRNMTKLQAIYG